ncbi:MAG TPA: hypothetical protein VGC52_12450, partial [Gemmatimonadaceae bacterium]
PSRSAGAQRCCVVDEEATVLPEVRVEREPEQPALVISRAERGDLVRGPTPWISERDGYEDVGLGRSPAPRYPLECVDPVTRAKLERVLPEAARSRLAQVARSGVWDTQRKTMVSNIRKMRDAGIPIAMGRESDLGSVDQGKHADLTIFDADPGANIRNARTVVMVMRGGILYSRRALLPTHQ